MEQIFTVELTINWTIEINNQFESKKNELLYKSAFLNLFDSEMDNIENVTIDSVNDDILKGIVTVTKQKVFRNPNKKPEECVKEYMDAEYFTEKPSKFVKFDLENVKVTEERTEVIIDTDSFCSDYSEC